MEGQGWPDRGEAVGASVDEAGLPLDGAVGLSPRWKRIGLMKCLVWGL